VIEAVLQLPDTDEHVRSLVQALARRAPGDFRALVAFVLKGELTDQLWRAIDGFCRGGGRIDWVVGTDFGGTDAASLRRLYRLQMRYPANRVRIMRLGGSAGFHPKLYWISRPNEQFALIGSANCTQGGFGKNLEISVKVHERGKDSDRAERMLRELWEAVDETRPPLSAADFYPLDLQLIQRVEQYHRACQNVRRAAPRHPLRHRRLPRQRPIHQVLPRPRGRRLVMELTMEQGPGRMTQVQPPRAVWQRYFGVDLQNPLPLSVRNERAGGPYEPRPVVRHHHVWTIEIPEADVPRPAIIRFRRTGRRRYAYSVFTPGDPEYPALERLLTTSYNPWRTKAQERRWLPF
jgi:hypothetical protein